MDEQSPWPGYFQVACCRRRRGLLPGNVLVCSNCDYDHGKVTSLPNENQVRDVPDGEWYLYPKEEPNA